ncbi:MAG: hypothetical protein SFT91_01785 [Rickettsiaceae bacterium]|nr:hypothetical protein [Rickettsiaceae bacterium]
MNQTLPEGVKNKRLQGFRDGLAQEMDTMGTYRDPINQIAGTYAPEPENSTMPEG